MAIGHRNYGANYGGSHPGDDLAFVVVIIGLIVLAGIAYASAQ